MPKKKTKRKKAVKRPRHASRGKKVRRRAGKKTRPASVSRVKKAKKGKLHSEAEKKKLTKQEALMQEREVKRLAAVEAREKKKKLEAKKEEEAALSDEMTLDKTPMKIYLQQIEDIPLLNPEDELTLAEKITRGGTEAQEARMRMIRSNLRLVISIAKRYANIGLPFSDLVEEGNIGLMRAVDKFSHTRGYRFSTYASWWIKQAIMRALSNQGKTIRVPVYMYDVITKWRKVRDGLTQKLGREPTRKEVSDVMGLPIKKVKEVERIASQPSSLNAPVSLDGAAELIDLVEDQHAPAASDNIQELFTTERIDLLLAQVDERAREILTLRFGLKGGEPQTLEETAKRFNVTRERVRQIESASLEKIREFLKHEKESLRDYVKP